MQVVLRFLAGTLEVRGLQEGALQEGGLDLGHLCRFDKRTACYRAPAVHYADVVRELVRNKIAFEDEARAYDELDDLDDLGKGARQRREPRPYQKEALEAWVSGRGRGCVVLPTGAGKTQVALMAIDDKRRSTLVVVPTLDLLRQWHQELETAFGVDVGVIGGGDYDVQPLTVTTYDSAHIHMENLGAKFGLIIFDEVHHLPAPAYATAARMSLAPFRLGLSATPEREDGAERMLRELVGPIVFREEIDALAGEYLASYDTERIAVEISDAARAEYDSSREIYRAFLKAQGIYVGTPRGWSTFIMRAAASDEGRAAFLAYRRQKEIAQAAPEKVDVVRSLLEKHRGERIIIFTHDNATAYKIARTLLVPIITHQNRVKERTEILDCFRSGEYDCVVTSRVLNEGVDVPDAGVAIVVSGTGSVREHVQRLGRILRKSDGKRAVLYELITKKTAEAFTSRRRRNHVAYKESAPPPAGASAEDMRAEPALVDDKDASGGGDAHE